MNGKEDVREERVHDFLNSTRTAQPESRWLRIVPWAGDSKRVQVRTKYGRLRGWVFEVEQQDGVTSEELYAGIDLDKLTRVAAEKIAAKQNPAVEAAGQVSGIYHFDGQPGDVFIGRAYYTDIRARQTVSCLFKFLVEDPEAE